MLDNKSLNERVYTKFTRKVNNAEIVKAEHINELQKGISTAQQDVIKLYDKLFVDKALFEFDNNLYVNSIFVDEIKDKQYSDLSLSSNVNYDTITRTISITNNSLKGEYFSTKIHSYLGEGVPLNDFFLVTDEYIPIGSKINYYIITHDNQMFPIKANNKKPFKVTFDTFNIRIKAELIKNSAGESPKINGLALMFFDPAVEAQYGLTNPDLRRFEELTVGVTVLVRDRALGDKLVKVIEPSSITELFYNENEELEKVATKYEMDGVVVEETLNYGDYLNSAGETDRVLLSILKASRNMQATQNNLSYKFFE